MHSFYEYNIASILITRSTLQGQVYLVKPTHMQNTRERYGFLAADLLGENLLPISLRTNLIRSLATAR